MGIKKAFQCTNCGAKVPKWEGKCQSCGEWNTLEEEIVEKLSKKEIKRANWRGNEEKLSKPTLVQDIQKGELTRFGIEDKELSRTFSIDLRCSMSLAKRACSR